MTKIEFNINNYVEFKLTEYGAKILNDLAEGGYSQEYPLVQAFKNKPLYAEGQYMKMQLWNVMSTFGEYTSLGLETFCKNATIVLEIK